MAAVHAPSSAVLYKGSTRGTATGSDLHDAAVDAAGVALDRVLERPLFRAALEASTDPPPATALDRPDPPGSVVAAALSEEEEPTTVRAATLPGTGRVIGGTIGASVGAAAIVASWLDYEIERAGYDFTRGRFGAEQVVNTVGWAGVIAGTVAGVSGLVKMGRASRAARAPVVP